MNLNAMDQYWIWLSSIYGIGPKRFYQLISVFEDARSVWDNANDPQMREILGPKTLKNLRDARNERYFYTLFARLERSGMKAVTRLSDDYPSLLSRIYDPPPTLYVLGDADLTGERMFSIIGSRHCTRDGQKTARDFGEALAKENVTVVSGMASGIDTCAHEGALMGMGTTIAVLGCGADVVYPSENRKLYDSILTNGGAVISEYMPSTQPSPGNFPARNRIISGLSQGVMLVEGAAKSGAMITVNFALEQGRDVFAVPGSIHSPKSLAPNQLIVDGAIPAISPWQILEHFRWAQRPGAVNEPQRPTLQLDAEDDQIVRPLLEQELSFEELANLVDFPVSKLNSHLTMLELRGIIIKAPGGMYRALLSVN